MCRSMVRRRAGRSGHLSPFSNFACKTMRARCTRTLTLSSEIPITVATSRVDTPSIFRRNTIVHVSAGARSGRRVGDLVGTIEDGLRGRVLRQLQVRVRLVIERVQLLPGAVAFPGRFRRSPVRLDGFFPVAESRKRMRGHVQCMRNRGRERGILARRNDRSVRQRRRVVRNLPVMRISIRRVRR